MDGLDTYVDDYSIADPIAPDIVRQLMHRPIHLRSAARRA